jgi:lipoate-protein ligase A
MPWQFVNTGFCNGAFNMRFDENLALSLRRGTGHPTVRVFGWNPYCISLGYNQKEQDIDSEKCQREGIDVVRRPTGGRAILHAEELTYSVVMFANGRNVLETYNEISRALVRGLKLLGAEVELTKSQPNFQKLYREPSSIPCFSSSARYEIEYKGRKLVGSAQRRFDDVVLQHGSVLTGDFHQRLVEFINPQIYNRSAQGNSPLKVEEIKKDLSNHTITLSDILQREITFDELADCIRRGFELEWNVEFTQSEASESRSILKNNLMETGL